MVFIVSANVDKVKHYVYYTVKNPIDDSWCYLVNLLFTEVLCKLNRVLQRIKQSSKGC